MKTVYTISGVKGLQAFSTQVVSGNIMPELEKIGWQIIDINIQRNSHSRLIIRWLQEVFYRYWSYPRQCARQIPENSIVYILDHSYAGVVLHLKKSCRTLLHTHDMLSMRPPWDFPYPVRLRNILIWLLGYLGKRQGIKKASKLVAVSHFTATQIEKYLGIKEDKITVVHNGTSPCLREKYDCNQERAKLGIQFDSKVILTVGPASLRKNYQVLMDALIHLQGDFPSITWLHIGKMEPVIRQRLIGTDFCNLIELPYIDDICCAYMASDLLVSPSLYEGFGLPPMEAVACGIPVVVSRIPAAIETLGEQANWFDPDNPVELADCIRRVIANHGVCPDVAWAENFSWGKAAELIDQQLNSLAIEGQV